MSDPDPQLTRYAWDFFLAHAGPDGPVAENLYDLLSPHCRVFLDSRVLILGDDWDRKLPAAQRDARVTVVLVSTLTDKAYYQREEIAAAIDMARRDETLHRVVPVYLDAASSAGDGVPYGLRLKHAVSAVGPGGLQDVAQKLLGLLAQLGPGAAPAAPAAARPHLLQVSFKTRQMDGHSTRRVDGSDADWFEHGCKFRIASQNAGHEQVVIDALDFVLEEYRPLGALEAAAPNVTAMRFGDAVVPHQLFLELYPERFEGWWVITGEGGARDRKALDPASRNLLDTESGEAVAFTLQPRGVELINGAVVAKEPGFYKVSFSFEYSTFGGETRRLKTPSLPIVEYPAPRR